MPRTPSNEVFGYLPAVVKTGTAGARIEFGLQVAAGLATFDAPRAVALNVATSIASECGFDLIARPSQRKAREPAEREPVLKPKGTLL